MKRPSSPPLYSELWVIDRKSSYCDFGHLPYCRPGIDMHNVRPISPSVYSSIRICTGLPCDLCIRHIPSDSIRRGLLGLLSCCWTQVILQTVMLSFQVTRICAHIRGDPRKEWPSSPPLDINDHKISLRPSPPHHPHIQCGIAQSGVGSLVTKLYGEVLQDPMLNTRGVETVGNRPEQPFVQSRKPVIIITNGPAACIFCRPCLRHRWPRRSSGTVPLL